MILNFQSIIDLVLNTLENEFLLDTPCISKFIKKTSKIEIEVVDSNDYDRKYQVTIYTEQENENIVSIRSAYLTIVETVIDGRFILGSFTSNGLIEFEESIKNVLGGVKFYEKEMEELQ